jgi:glycosyltransferase involved in cell wall biosynthesis
MYKLNLPFIFGPVGGGQSAPVEFKCYFGKYWKIEVARNITSRLLLLLNPSTKGALRSANNVLVSNRDTEKLAKKTGARNISLFFDTGLPSSFFPSEVPLFSYNNVLRILWVGRLMPRKGLKLVLDSLAKVKLLVDFQLTIVGDGEMGIFVNDWLRELDLVNKVTWMGQIPFDEVKEQYIKSDLFILTSLRDSCPAQLLEAMAFGLPVITLDLHGASLAVPDNTGIKIKPTTPEETKEEIANAVIYFSKNKEVLKQMGANAHKYALQQTWEKKVGYVYNNFYQLTEERIPKLKPCIH